jgi:phage terminase large subunit-like protein
MFTFERKKGAPYKFNYEKIIAKLTEYRKRGNNEAAIELMRDLVLNDLFFLGYFVLGIKILNHPWAIKRILEVEQRHNRTLDLWAREHLKSTLLTYLLTIQKILKNPEERICIFSFERQIAKGFLRRLKHTFESHDLLRALFPDVIWKVPARESPKWSEDEGLILRRKGAYNEATIEAWGLIDGMPISKHYSIRIYDDLVTDKSVLTPERIRRTKSAFQLSHALGSINDEVRVIGTTYHFRDLYEDLKKDPTWYKRIYPAEDKSGNSVYLPQEVLDQKRRDMGSYNFAAQMLLNPVAEEEQIFEWSWLEDQFYRKVPEMYQLAILVDPANEKKEWSDYTVIMCVGIDRLGNFFVLDMVRDKIDLVERWEALSQMVTKWKCRRVGYEKYTMTADIKYFKEKMMETGIYFNIIPLAGGLSKHARIMRLVPLFETSRIFIPERLEYRDVTGKKRDLVSEFIHEEYLQYPYSVHEDMLDCMSRIRDEDIKFSAPMREIEDVERKSSLRNLIDEDDTAGVRDSYLAV